MNLDLNKTSKLFSINVRDVLRGAIVSGLSGASGLILEALNAQANIDWNTVGNYAIAGALGYIVKNFFTKGGV